MAGEESDGAATPAAPRSTNLIHTRTELAARRVRALPPFGFRLRGQRLFQHLNRAADAQQRFAQARRLNL